MVVDVLGTDERATKEVSPRPGGGARLDFVGDYGVGPGAPLRAALGDALRSADEEDGEVS